MGEISTYRFYNEREIFCEDTGERVIGYNSYMNTKHWSNVRELLFASKGRKCDFCSTESGKMIAHHIRYANLGHEDINNDLVPLCETCHKFIHKHMDKYPKYYDINERKDIKRKQVVEKKREKRREYNKKVYANKRCRDCFYKKRIAMTSTKKEFKLYCKYFGTIILDGSRAETCKHLRRRNNYKGAMGKKVDCWQKKSGYIPYK